MRARLLALLGGCLIACWPAYALANGRFPAANSIVFAPDGGGRYIVRTTFGLLEMPGTGQAPTWTCEQALGFASEEDPQLVIAPSGARVVATSAGVVQSSDECAFREVSGLDDRLVMDLTLDVDRGRVLVLGVEIRDDGTTRSRIYGSTDDGESFEPVGAPFPDELLPITLDTAPLDGDRIYVTGRLKTEAGYAGVFYASSDGGRSFAAFSVPDTDSTRLPFIAAVSPTDPDSVYVRVSDPDGSVLWISGDGGESFERAVQGTGALLGFAVSPDGSRIAFGGPDDGVFVAAADGARPRRTSDLGVTCLGWNRSGLYACGSTSGDDAIVFHSEDEGESFDPVFGKSELTGETGCAMDTPVGSACAAAWPAVAALLAPPDVTPPEPEGGRAGAPTSPPESPPASAPASDTGDGCALNRRASDSSAPWLLSLAAAILARRLSRRSS